MGQARPNPKAAPSTTPLCSCFGAEPQGARIGLADLEHFDRLPDRADRRRGLHKANSWNAARPVSTARWTILLYTKLILWFCQ